MNRKPRSNQKIELEIHEISSREVELQWFLDENINTKNSHEKFDCFTLDITNITTTAQFSFTDIINNFVRFSIPTLTPGCSYKARLRALQQTTIDLNSGGNVNLNKTVFVSNTLSFDAVFNIRELSDLRVKASEMISRCKQQFISCENLYRNKSKKYFDDIQNSDGIMHPYLKDNNGDPASPINNRIKGLFFATWIDPKTNQPPRTSPFGEKRLYIPARRLFNSGSSLYFTDFYCIKRHWVTLVLTKSGSIADDICSSALDRLNINNNEFLYWDYRSECLMVSRAVLVEVMYTDDIDIGEELRFGAFFRSITCLTPGGESKYSHHIKSPACKTCNIYNNKIDKSQI